MKIAPLILLAALLCACGDDSTPASGAAAQPEQASSEASSSDDRAADEYRAKVQSKMRDSAVNSLAREWSVPRENVRCVLGKVKISQVEQANTDPAVKAVFEECGVDPAVVD